MRYSRRGLICKSPALATSRLLTECTTRAFTAEDKEWMDVYKRRVWGTIHSEEMKSSISELLKTSSDNEHILPSPSALKLSEIDVDDHIACSPSFLLLTRAAQFFISRLYHENGKLYLKCNYCIDQTGILKVTKPTSHANTDLKRDCICCTVQMRHS